MKRIYIEITNNCNLNCSFCRNKKGNDFINVDQFESITDQIKEYTNYIYLHILGEPLLHKQFDDFLYILDKKDFQLQLVTNGTLLYQHPDILTHKCLRKLSISIHSINNIDVPSYYFDTINKLIENNNNKTIELRFYNKTKLDDKLNNFLDYLKNRFDYIETKKDNSYRLKNNVYVYYQDFFKWPNIDDEFVNEFGTCHGGIDMIGINSKLDVTLCCLDPNAYNKIGNLNKESLHDILESEHYKKIIDDFKNHRITLDLCKKCTYRLRFK